MCSRSAALVKLSSSATATKYRRCSISTLSTVAIVTAVVTMAFGALPTALCASCQVLAQRGDQG